MCDDNWHWGKATCEYSYILFSVLPMGALTKENVCICCGQKKTIIIGIVVDENI